METAQWITQRGGHYALTVKDNQKTLRRTLKAFAEVLGVHRTYMGGVERGERNLTLKSVERMAEKLGMEARDLLG